jgi:hypothetical protein
MYLSHHSIGQNLSPCQGDQLITSTPQPDHNTLWIPESYWRTNFKGLLIQRTRVEFRIWSREPELRSVFRAYIQSTISTQLKKGWGRNHAGISGEVDPLLGTPPPAVQ